MLFYIIRRLITAVAMLLIVTLTTFVMFFAGPVDPARLTCAKNCTPAVVEGNRKFMGFDKPVMVQYGDFLKGIVVGRDYPDDPEMRANAPQTVAHCDAPASATPCCRTSP
ncbi:hypothetical protein [Arsenicicoccus piscis]|uniref:ABC transporter type 1 GsiC-like N-terminal domain-containing protein n=1 Tax=Arsenicicoccus piscis TaxID=673954 RepID=A0ABQ6HIQ3_9MICO|nr:hypothetical protein [Arsenicicoccus piscis]GMA18426.1 hypothetical protein GCM10025862_04470 [Arsenicicoccus piscis]